jgi:hypothetical protein
VLAPRLRRKRANARPPGLTLSCSVQPHSAQVTEGVSSASAATAASASQRSRSGSKSSRPAAWRRCQPLGPPRPAPPSRVVPHLRGRPPGSLRRGIQGVSRAVPTAPPGQVPKSLDPVWTRWAFFGGAPRTAKTPPERGFCGIGETGFEPATARPPAGCATRLRYSPQIGRFYAEPESGRRGSNPFLELGRLPCNR